jgi:hypothetical protein
VPDHDVFSAEIYSQQTAARLLADSGRLGESLSYSLTTEDQLGIDRVVKFVMERYQNEGRNPFVILKHSEAH